MAAFVVLVENEPHSFFRNTELQNLLYRFTHDHGLVRGVDPRFESEISFYPRHIHKSCRPTMTLWTSEDGTCAVAKVHEKAGIWSDETIEFYSLMNRALNELHGQSVTAYIEPNKAQNDAWRLKSGNPDPYDGKSINWPQVCRDLKTTTTRKL
jgi:hypothetical protein